jgi:hypothetical protein
MSTAFEATMIGASTTVRIKTDSAVTGLVSCFRVLEDAKSRELLIEQLQDAHRQLCNYEESKEVPHVQH